MKEMWNDRFRSREYVYGKEPNAYFRQFLDDAEVPGKILLPGEGEGRNAVYAASLGWEVDAFDYSEEGQKKARKLATASNVKINYIVSDIASYTYPMNHYDLVGLFYLHLPRNQRKWLHNRISRSLNEGGHVVLEGFHKDQLDRQSGGPKRLDYLFSIEELMIDFIGLKVIRSEKRTMQLNSGTAHHGIADVVQLLLQKA